MNYLFIITIFNSLKIPTFILMKFFNNQFLFFGHRGTPHFAPENSMASFEKAIQMGVDGLELDVLLTNDDKIVVFHDYDLKRMAGIPNKIIDMDYNQLSKINISNNWTDQIGQQYIPLLDDVIDLVINTNIILNIEIKSTGIFSTKVVNLVLDKINKRQIEENCIVSSFNPLILRNLKKKSPNIFTSLLWSREEISFFQKYYKLLYWISKPNGFHPDINFIDEKLVNWAKKKEIPIFVFTVNTLEDLEKMKKMGVNGVISDNPEINK